MISLRDIAQRMDPVRAPACLVGAPTSWLDEADPLVWLLRQNIVDLVSSFPIRSQVGLMHRDSKGLFQLHRWPREHVPAFGDPAGRPISLRSMADRHSDASWTFRFLWYNTWLMVPPLGISAKPLVDQRRREIGEMIARRPYQIAALGEVWNESERQALKDVIGGTHAYDWARGPDSTFQLSSGLMTFAVDSVGIVARKGMAYESQGGGVDQQAEKGALHTELELRPGGSPERPRLDLFTTHLHAEEPDTRRDQLKELAAFIAQRRKPANPVIVAGDFNIDNRDTSPDEYARLLETMAALNLYDVWLSRGGMAGGTAVSEDVEDNEDYALTCTFDPGTRDAACADYPAFTMGTDHPVPGRRLDYVFVEEPTASHSVMIDIPRVRRLPFWRGWSSLYQLDSTHMYSNGVPDTGDGTPNFMSDHLGLEIELIVTPMSKVVAAM
jgi:endonuclease/exonuclease/phosphatase family metal-dependent hydrolase